MTSCNFQNCLTHAAPMSTTVVNQPISLQHYPAQPSQHGFTFPNANINMSVVNQPGADVQDQYQATQFPITGSTYPSPNANPNLPVVNQPGASIQYQFHGIQFPNAAPVNVWMPIPLEQLNEGFEYLSSLDGLLVHQLLEIFEVMTGYETNNRYLVKNTEGQIIYMVCEDSKAFDRDCFGSYRAFNIKIMDSRGIEVIHLSRKMNCDCCCCPCCLQEMSVVSPYARLNGKVKQIWSCCNPKLQIMTDGIHADLEIDGPACMCCSDIVFKISNSYGNVVGNITKKWMGYFMEAHTDVDNFELSFPRELTINQKIMLIGTTLLLDFMYFEFSSAKKR